MSAKKVKKYVIVDVLDKYLIVSKCFTDLDEAKARCRAWRKKRYANGNLTKEFEYDRIECDMGYHVIEISDPIF